MNSTNTTADVVIGNGYISSNYLISSNWYITSNISITSNFILDRTDINVKSNISGDNIAAELKNLVDEYDMKKSNLENLFLNATLPLYNKIGSLVTPIYQSIDVNIDSLERCKTYFDVYNYYVTVNKPDLAQLVVNNMNIEFSNLSKSKIDIANFLGLDNNVTLSNLVMSVSNFMKLVPSNLDVELGNIVLYLNKLQNLEYMITHSNVSVNFALL
jgi:hypothetical protein